MTTALAAKNIIRRNSDGNEYSIPLQHLSHFQQLDEAVQNAEWDSLEWHEACDEFNNQFEDFKKE